MMDLALLLFQEDPGNAVGVARLFAGFFMVLTFYSVALLFTYWISKDE